jgi:iron(III) transport system permease protein
MDSIFRNRGLSIKGVYKPLLNGWSLFVLIVAVFVSVPVLVVFGNVLRPAGEVWHHLASTVLADYIKNSLWLIIGVGAGTLSIGVVSAWLCSMCYFPGRRIFEWSLLLPMAIPAYIIAYTYNGMFEFAGPVQSALRDFFGWSRDDYWFPEIRSLGGAITVMSLVLYPYVYLLTRAAFLEQSVCVLEASRTLGRSPLRSFTDIALPLARPAIIAGVSLALMEALNDYGAVQYFGVSTFTTGIFRTWFGLGNSTAAAQLAAMLMIFIFAIVIAERWSRGKARFHHTSTRYRSLPGYQLKGWYRGLAFVICFIPIFFGFLLPAGQLLIWTVETGAEMIDGRFLTLTLHTLLLASMAAILAVILALAMVYGLRLKATSVTAFAVRVASLGYAVPGAVIAVGVLLPFAWLDNKIDAWMRARSSFCISCSSPCGILKYSGGQFCQGNSWDG